ncbi:LamG domain-containing protein [Puniceicoccaceae bacterium K14]|nr:LamG domain-containing protein [Puniceicoccaceae bacterium K14]
MIDNKNQKYPNTNRSTMRGFLTALLVSVSIAFSSYGVTVSSIADLATQAGNSNQDVVMTPGVYQMSDYLTSTVVANTVPDGNSRYAMILFSGNNNTFDFTGVTIEVDTALLDDFGNKVIEFHVTGDNVDIKGLTVTDIGNSPTSSGGQSLTVSGDNITIENVTLNMSGSSPYGYGDLLGKGNPNLVPMQKHSGLLVEGQDISIIGCSIFSRSFGHLYFVQGGRNVLFENCYAESTTRTTDEMLAETSGLAYDVNFEAVYRNYNGDKVITPGYTKSVSEVGYRLYAAGGVDGNTTGEITLINCIARNTRSGFALNRFGGDVTVINCEATGCEVAYTVEGVTIENSRGDAVNGPLLYLNGDPSHVELSLLPDVNVTTLHAIATIGGDDHVVTLNTHGGTRPATHSILIGSTRPAGANPFSPLGTTATSNITLNNNTGIPVEIGSTASNCTIRTNGTTTDNGTGNSVTSVPSNLVSQDIGDVAASGSASLSGGTYTVDASGSDIWNAADEFHFTYESLSGDGEIIARVVSVENTNKWAKAGVMIRETLETDAKEVMMLQRPDNQVNLQWRQAKGGSSASAGLQGGTSSVKYLRLKRSGDEFTGYYSTSSASGPWTQLGSTQTIDMNTVAFVGLATTSHNDGTLCTAVYDNVSIVEVSDENIAGEWTFDNVSASKVYDSGLYGRDACRSGGTTVSGNTGNALNVDGSNDSVTLPPSVFNTVSDEVTISMWVNGDAPQPRSDTIFRAEDSSGNRILNIHLPWGNSQVYWDAGHDGSSYDRISQSASSSQFEGQWNHWVFVKDASSGQMMIYLNGSLWKSGSGKTKAIVGISSVSLGSAINNSQAYDGSIDEVIIYDIALSASEVSSLYNSY